MPAGVLGVDDGIITISNAAADRLLGGEHGLIGPPLDTVRPTSVNFGSARSLRLQGFISHNRVDDAHERVLNVRVTGSPGRDGRASVITLDDMSDLVTAQRTAAWADVARRIAHEIRNPLTPIQLSAERLKRRYGRHIVEGSGRYSTSARMPIIRQVDDIERMVDEFFRPLRVCRRRARRETTSPIRSPGDLPDAGGPDDVAF